MTDNSKMPNLHVNAETNQNAKIQQQITNGQTSTQQDDNELCKQTATERLK